MAFNSTVTFTGANLIDAATQAALTTDMQAALAQWGGYLSGPGTINVQMNIAPGQGGINGGPQNLVALPSNIGESGAEYKLNGSTFAGAYFDPAAVNIKISMDPAVLAQSYDLQLNNTPASPVTAGKVDMISVFTHELMHGLGMSGALSWTPPYALLPSTANGPY